MLARWNPWQDLFDMQRDVDALTRRFFGTGSSTPFANDKSGNGATWTPAMDVFSREGDIVVRAELPGVDPEKDVEISWDDGILTLRGERREEQRTENENYLRVESRYGSFERSIALPTGVKADDISAKYDSGILEIVVPRAAEATSAKKIPVSVGGERQALDATGQKKETAA